MKNGQSSDASNIGHKTKNEDKPTHVTKKMSKIVYVGLLVK